MALHSGYKGANTCTKGPQTGARGFMSWYLAKYKTIGGQNSGIYNCRKVRGSNKTTSLHGEGRAVDLGLKYTRKEFQTLANLLRTHSKELGIQCIIYNRKIFSGGYSNKNWQTYKGVNPHTDHLHVEMAWWSARMSASDYVALLERTIGKKVSGNGGVIPQGNTSKPKPKPAPKVEDQSRSNTPDGSTKFPKNYAELAVNGNFLSWEVGALQILLKNVIGGENGRWDGEFKKLTITDTMTLMQRNGYYLKTPFAARGAKKGVPLTKDGKDGYWFWVEFQRMLGDANGNRGKSFYDLRKWAVDGKPETETKKGIQRFLNYNN